MKRLLSAILRGCWRRTAPLRRPLARKLDGHLVTVMAYAVRGPILERLEVLSRLEHSLQALPRLEHSLQALPRLEHSLQALSILESQLQEMSLALNALIREVVRLQMQIEALEPAGDESGLVRGGLTVVGGEEADGFDPMAQEQSRVG